MTDTSNTPATDDLERFPRIKLYRNKRVVRPLLAALCVVFLTADPFIGFVSYILSGLYLDWLFFTRNGYKDSALLPESCFESIGVTGKQVDRRNEFMANVRRGAFGTSIAVTIACLLTFPKFSYQCVFVTAYIGITIGSMLIAISKGKIVSLYEFGTREDLVPSAYPLSTMDTHYYNAASDNKISNPYA